ncbi:MAG: bifunctional phosphopantothenoylcysteine decarboxylase/phosphopantothenate--cysteine ligase CoaBC [Dehalococcoidia bacterium]|nr:bifunctional phosphopantothenoylcysteine decarboxylase/phosphopantothenate--cysteine ligase CoaBC [Dehalococcoidia bacterium]
MKGKNVVLGVTGGIAAYKAVELASQMVQSGAEVRVVMTEAATKLVSPFTFRAITGRPVTTSMWEDNPEFRVQHISLADLADVVVIAPCTANTIAKLACGIADNELCAVVLATRAPVVLAPSMNVNMWENPVTQENLERLKKRGFIVVEPTSGHLACGWTGKGRLPEVRDILGVVSQVLGRKGDLAGKMIVVTAGGTREAIDPVRCITNYSSGKMGYAIAEAARDRGAQVTLITAPTALPTPSGMKVISVTSAQEMFEEVRKAVNGSHALIMAAAVADYRPSEVSSRKLKRQKSETLTLKLERTPDILSSVTGNFLRVGFAAESEDLEKNAREKLVRKKLDLVIGNDVAADTVFGADTNRVIIIDRQGAVERLPLLTKREVAERILDRIVRLL